MTATDDRNGQIYADFLAGVDGATIGRKMGISRERVRQIIRDAGLKPKREIQRVRRERVANSIRTGMTAKEVANAHGETIQYVHTVAHAYGLSVPRMSKDAMAQIDGIIDLAIAGKASVFALTKGDKTLRKNIYKIIQERGLSLPHRRARARVRKETIERIKAHVGS